MAKPKVSMQRRPVAPQPTSKPPDGPPSPPDPRDTMLYTLGFTLAAFFFVIGVYQTMVEKDLPGNYWLFMLSAAILLALRWWRQRKLRG